MAALKKLTKKGLKGYIKKVLGRELEEFLPTALTNLKGVRKLLTLKKNWAWGVYDDGYGRYCLIGACHKVDGPGEHCARVILSYAVKELTTYPSIIDFNDSLYTKHSDILTLLNKAIALTKSCLPAKRKARAALLATHKLPVK